MQRFRVVLRLDRRGRRPCCPSRRLCPHRRVAGGPTSPSLSRWPLTQGAPRMRSAIRSCRNDDSGWGGERGASALRTAPPGRHRPSVAVWRMVAGRPELMADGRSAEARLVADGGGGRGSRYVRRVIGQ